MSKRNKQVHVTETPPKEVGYKSGNAKGGLMHPKVQPRIPKGRKIVIALHTCKVFHHMRLLFVFAQIRRGGRRRRVGHEGDGETPLSYPNAVRRCKQGPGRTRVRG